MLNRARHRGAAEVAGELGSKLHGLRGESDTLHFLVREAGGRDPEAPEGLVLARALPEHAGLYARDVGTDSAATFRGRLTGTTSCFLVLDGRRALHASWVTTHRAWTSELSRYVVCPPGAAYLYESFTRPEARGRGIYPYVLEAVAALLAPEVDEIWIGVGAGNRPSRRAIEKGGFSPAFEIDYTRKLRRVRLGTPRGPRAADAQRLLGPGLRGV